ncbi:hypothetical protein DMH18_17490 [Streptomyces sp. WAC 06783]|nr:hypothetical protein DMH18_17490 [Streptomyces sp. WAC 06783]
MQTRPAIDLARGILMATFSLTSEAAWAALVTTSQNTNTKLHRLAEDLVNSVHGPVLSENVRGHLGAAVAKAQQAPPQPGAEPVPTNRVPPAVAHRTRPVISARTPPPNDRDGRPGTLGGTAIAAGCMPHRTAGGSPRRTVAECAGRSGVSAGDAKLLAAHRCGAKGWAGWSVVERGPAWLSRRSGRQLLGFGPVTVGAAAMPQRPT